MALWYYSHRGNDTLPAWERYQSAILATPNSLFALCQPYYRLSQGLRMAIRWMFYLECFDGETPFLTNFLYVGWLICSTIGSSPLELFHLLRHVAELLIPLLAKATDKRLTQKLIERKMKLPALLPATLADFPAMVVQSYATIAELFFTNRIECTAHGLAELAASTSECSF